MSLDHIYTPEEENLIFGRDMMVSYLSVDGFDTGSIDIQVDGTGDLKLSNGLTELVLSHITMLLSTVYDYVSALGELPYHPNFGSALPNLLLSAAPTDEQIEVMQNEIILSVFTHFSDLVTGLEFAYIQFNEVERQLQIHMTIYTVTSAVGSLTVVV